MAVDAPPQAQRPGARTGGLDERYRSLFVAGRGGMGSVDVALERGTGGFERIVALKHLLPEQARDPRHKQMFLREARLAAMLRHRNVVHAFAFGEIYGELFLSMEYVEGETLAQALETSRVAGTALDPATVAYLLAEVCEGLHAAHELRDERGRPLNVVHRDVCPHNVMIAYDGHVKLLDFGVAKFDTGGTWTRTGEIKGKMAYMSPEQAMGDPLDRRSDLYSVGAVLFECLTGHRMWGTGTDLEVMRRIALEAPPQLGPNAPPALAALHARLVAKDPAQRPATAAEVAGELRAYASAWPRADQSTVVALMGRLFAGDMARRRGELNTALTSVAPARVAQLRETLDLGTSFTRPTLTEAVIVEATRPSRRRRSKVPWTRILAVAAALVAVVTAGVVVRGRQLPAVSTGPAPSTPTGVTSPQPSSSPSVASVVPTPPPATIAPPPSPRPAPPRGKVAPPRPPAGARPPDVDPTPF